jgi:glycosyltransferase involved in cell wall biosynthesis
VKIALAVHQFLPEYYAGTEVLTYRTARELRNRGHEIIIFAGYPAMVDVPLEDQNRFDEYTHDGFHVYRFLQAPVPMGNQSNPVEIDYNNELVRDRFVSILAKHRVDLVHSFHFNKISTSIIDACVARGLPVLFTATDFWMVCPASTLQLPDHSVCPGPDSDSLNCIRHYLQLSLPEQAARLVADAPEPKMRAYLNRAQKGQPFTEKFFGAGQEDYNLHFQNTYTGMMRRPAFLQTQARKLSRIIVPTKLVERIFSENGLPREKLQLIPYGVDLDGLIRHHNRGKREQLHIGYIGTMKEHKGVHVLIDAVRRLARTVGSVRLSLYGDMKLDPEYSKRLYELAAGNQNIEFKGTFEPDQIWQILSDFDVLVVPSTWYENTPLVVLSAQAAGCPVMATDLEGMSEAIRHRFNGMLFPSADVNVLSEQLAELNSNRTLLEELSSNCIMPSSIPEYIDRLEQVYREVVPVLSAG